MKNLSRKLLLSILTVALVFIALGTSTFAWFSINKTVSAGGMKVKAVAEGSIVISTSMPTATTKSTSVDFAEETAHELYASTHCAIDGTYVSGLKRVKNPSDVNPETGTPLNQTASLEYAAAANDATRNYFVDYTVYLAGEIDAFTNQVLEISLTGTWNDATKNINKAVSIDFFAKTVSAAQSVVSSDTYFGTLNVAGTVNSYNANTVTAEEKTKITINGASIPSVGNGALAITMRVYFDGELIEAGGNKYATYVSVTGSATDGVYYYTTNTGSAIAARAAGQSVEGLYAVDAVNCAKTYARTTTINSIEDVVLSVKFNAKDAA